MAAETAVLAAITVVLLAGVTPDQATRMLAPLLAPFGIPGPVVAVAVGLVVPHVYPPQFGQPASAAGWAYRTEPARHAAYLLRAAQRLTDRIGPAAYRVGAATVEQQGEAVARVIRPGDIDRERTYLRQHLEAGRLRREAAQRVDAEAAVRGPWLGWWATLDSRTTGECRAAHGHNFRVDQPPSIGYPGMPHGGTCRCRPGVPHVAGLSVDRAVAGVPVR